MFHGSITALVTPMSGDGKIDFGALEKLVAWQLENGTSGLVIAGTTGEAATLSEDELSSLWKQAVECVGGRVPVIAGTGTHCTATSVDRTRVAQKAGADAALVVTPYYNKPTQAGLLAHFRAIADAVDLPVLLYNVPGRTGVDLQPETTAQLAGHPGIAGLKEAVPGRERLEKTLELCGRDFCVLSGDDASCATAVLAGARGVVSVASNVAPAAMARLVALAAGSERGECEALDRNLKPLFEALMVQSNPIPVKWALYRMGLIGTGIRLPLTPLTPEFEAQVERALRASGLLEE